MQELETAERSHLLDNLDVALRERVQILRPTDFLKSRYENIPKQSYQLNLNYLIRQHPAMHLFEEYTKIQQDAFVSCLASLNITEERLERMYKGKLHDHHEEGAYHAKRGWLLLDHSITFAVQHDPSYDYQRDRSDPDCEAERLRKTFIEIVKPLNPEQRKELVEVLYIMRTNKMPEYTGPILEGLPTDPEATPFTPTYEPE
ncbi:MAG: hypothetical protein HY430_00865 [Candidatus Levybacteria bacterium]|nr:hypothetical protein [Candidatus Levybacteria bacterium]